MALEAPSIEDKVGTMLPRNVIVQELGEGAGRSRGNRPGCRMAAIENAALRGPAEQVRIMLWGAIESL